MQTHNPRRRALARGLVALAMLVAGVPPAVGAEPDHSLVPEPNGPELTWDGAPATAANVTWFPAGYNTTDAGGLCGKDVATYCEDVLVRITTAGHLDLRLTDIALNPSGLVFDDYDVFLYTSDAQGTPVDMAESSANEPGADELISLPVVPGHYLARVVYVSTALGGYRGHVSLTAPSPPVVAPAPIAPPSAAPPAAKRAAPARRPKCKTRKQRRTRRCRAQRRARA